MMRGLVPGLGAALLLAASPGPVAASPSRLVTSGARAILACPASGAHVIGSGNRITVDGGCASLEVVGSDNEVTVDLLPGSTSRIEGNHNRLIFTGPRAPEVVTLGAYNVVVPLLRSGDSAAAGPLLLDPTSPSFDVSCHDRDVVISGDNQGYVLRDGCRSLTVRGKLNRITAELVPGAPVAIGGAGVLLNYVLVAPGPAPVIRVTAAGLRAKQLNRTDDGVLSLPIAR